MRKATNKNWPCAYLSKEKKYFRHNANASTIRTVYANSISYHVR